MTTSPGSPYIFDIQRISADDGLMAPYSLVSAADRIFFLSPQGFKMLVPGGYPQPIGKERIDRTFFANVDQSAIQLVIGASDPTSTRVYWAYKSLAGTSGQFDQILCYDWALDKWTPIVTSGEYIASLAKPGITLEQVDTIYGSNLDTLTIDSLDSISNASQRQLSCATTSHAIGFFSGSALQATLQTPEQGDDFTRVFVAGVKPVSDAPSIFTTIMSRENAQATSAANAETAVNAEGICPQRISTRYAKAKVRIPSGTNWTYATAVEPDTRVEGRR